ncbi:MAG: glycosyl transferase family 1 [Gammaproteobacteria bacterium]|nr:MAG: glycosyl transferase family 1 [Gammaproteobacteria bacterium]
MRILMISDVYFPRINGVSTSIRSFREALQAHGDTVWLVAPAYGPDDERDDTLLRVPGRPVPFDPEDRLMHRRAVQEALARLADEPLDVVHVQTPFLAHYAGCRFARRRGLPVLATYHTLFEEYFHHYVPFLPRVLTRPAARALTRSQCRALDHLIVPSRPMESVLRGYGVRTPMTVLPTGLQLDAFEGGDGARFCAAHRIPADRPLLVHIGRVAHEKNIPFLLDVLDRLRHRRPDVLLVIAGEGPARSDLERRARRMGLMPHLRFVGYLDRRGALLDCYKAGDVFVFASRTETQGLVLLEAMALGVPVVSTAHLGTRDILQPGCGALVAEDDVEDFAAKVLRLLDDPDLRTRLGEAGRRWAQRWSAEAQAERLHALYESLCRPAPHATAA